MAATYFSHIPGCYAKRFTTFGNYHFIDCWWWWKVNLILILDFVITIWQEKVVDLKLTSHGILHYLCSVDLSKSFSELIVQYLSFLNIFFNRFCPVEECGVPPRCLYRGLLTLTHIDYRPCITNKPTNQVRKKAKQKNPNNSRNWLNLWDRSKW